MGCQSAKTNSKDLTTHKASLGLKFLLTLEYQCKQNLLEEENIASVIREFHSKFPSEKTFKIDFFISFLNKNINKSTEIPIDFYLNNAKKSKESEAYKSFNKKYLTFAFDFGINLSDFSKIFSSFEDPIKTKISFFNNFFKFEKKFFLSISKIESFLDFTNLTDITINLEWKNPRIKNKNFTKEIKFSQRLIIHGEYYFDALDLCKIDYKSSLGAKNALYGKESASALSKSGSLMDPEKTEIVDISRFKSEEDIDFLVNCTLKHLDKTNILFISREKTKNFQKKFSHFQRFLYELSKLGIYKDKLNYYLEKSLKLLMENLIRISNEKNEGLRNALLSGSTSKNLNNNNNDINLNNFNSNDNNNNNNNKLNDFNSNDNNNNKLNDFNSNDNNLVLNNYNSNNGLSSNNNNNNNKTKKYKKTSFEGLLIYILELAEMENKNLLLSSLKEIVNIAFDEFYAENFKALKMKILHLTFSLKETNSISVAKIHENLAAKQLEVFWFIFKSAFAAPESREIFKFILDLFFAVEKKIITLNEKSKEFYYFKFLNFEEKINQEFLENTLLLIKNDFTSDKNVFFKNFYLYNVEYFHPVYYLLAIKKFRLLIQENKERFYKLFIEVLETQNKENFVTQAEEGEEFDNHKDNFDYGLLKDFFYNFADLTEMEFVNQNLLLDFISNSSADVVANFSNNASTSQINLFNNFNNSYLTTPNPKPTYNNLNNFVNNNNANSNLFSYNNNPNNNSNYDYNSVSRAFNNNKNLISADGYLMQLKNLEVMQSVNIYNNNLMSKENEYYLKHGKFLKFFKFVKSYVKNFREYMQITSNMTFKSENFKHNKYNSSAPSNAKNLDFTYYDENEKNIFLEVSKTQFLYLLKEKIYKKLQKPIISATNKKNILANKKNSSSNTNKKYSRDHASVNNITNNNNNFNQNNNNNYNSNRNTESQFWLNNDNFDIDSYLDEAEKADINTFLNENLKKIIVENLICNEEINFKLEDLMVFLYPVYQNFFKDIFVFLLEKLFYSNALKAKDLIYIADFNFDFMFDLFTNGTFSFKLSEKIKEAIETKPILMELFEHKINKQFLEEFVLKNLNNFYKFEKKEFMKLDKNFVKAPERMLNICNTGELFKTHFVYKNINFLVTETLVKERILFLKLFFEFDQVGFFFEKFKEFFQSLISNITLNLKKNKNQLKEIYGIEASFDVERNVFYLFYNLFFEEYNDLSIISLKALKAYVPLGLEERDILLNEEEKIDFTAKESINFHRNSNKLRIRQSLESQSVRISSINNSAKMSNPNLNPGEAADNFEEIALDKENQKNNENLISNNINVNNLNNNYTNTDNYNISNLKNNLIDEINKENFYALHKVKFNCDDFKSKIKNPNQLLAENGIVKFNRNSNVAVLFNANSDKSFYLTHVYMKNPLLELKEIKIFEEKELKKAAKAALFLGGCGDFPKNSEIEKLKNFKIENYLNCKANENEEKHEYFDRFFYLGFMRFDINEREKYSIQKVEKLYLLDYLFVLFLSNFEENKSNYNAESCMYCANIGCLGDFDRENAEKIILKEYKFLKEKFLDENYRDITIDLAKN